MLYYSKLTKKFYDSEQECSQAEKEYEDSKRAAEQSKKEFNSKVNLEKEELSNKIKATEKSLSDAYNNYLTVREQAAKLLNKAYDDYNSMLAQAAEKIKNTQLDKYNAVKKYNEKYGSYIIHYKDEDALNELKRFFNFPDSLFDLLF